MSKRKRNTEKSLVDILIPVHGRFDLLADCLDSIPDAFGEISYSIHIVDNASPEGTEFYKGYQREIKVIESKTNMGFPASCNRLGLRSYCPLLFFLNSDVVLNPGAGKELVKAMDDPEVGAVGMKLIFPDYSTDEIRPAGKLQHICLSITIDAQARHMFIGWNPDHPKINALGEKDDVWAVTGAAMMTRRQLFRRTKGFNEIYGIGTWEDVEYCLTLRELGYKIRTVPNAVGTHFVGGTAEGYTIQYPLTLNRMIFLSRWQPRGLTWTDWEYF